MFILDFLEWIIHTTNEFSTLGITFRLLFALIVGLIVGIDRELKRRGAGIKTHVLVCIGSAMVMITSEYLVTNFAGGVDISRMGAQVISGVGFLGVGTIIVTGRNQVRGLTTAASLWVCACVGLAAGSGYVQGVVIALILLVFTLRILGKLDVIVHRHAKVFDLYIEFADNKGITKFVEKMREEQNKINVMQIGKGDMEEGPNAVVSLEIKETTKRATLIDDLRCLEYIRFVEEL